MLQYKLLNEFYSSSLKSKKATLEELEIPKELLDYLRHWRALNDIRFQILNNLKTKK